MAASARATSVRAPRLPPRGRFWLSWIMTGTVEKSTGAFHSWSISIGSSSAPAGETALFIARARAAAAFRSGFLSRASRRRSARRSGAGAASTSERKIVTMSKPPAEHERAEHAGADAPGARRTPLWGSDQEGSMRKKCRRAGGIHCRVARNFLRTDRRGGHRRREDRDGARRGNGDGVV